MVTKNFKEEIKIIVNKFVDILRKEMNIDRVYLFGSYVQGNFDEDSDIDIAVVSNDFDGDIIEDTMKLMRLRRMIDNRIEPHPYRENDFDRDDPFVKEIKQKGLKII